MDLAEIHGLLNAAKCNLFGPLNSWNILELEMHDLQKWWSSVLILEPFLADSFPYNPDFSSAHSQI